MNIKAIQIVLLTFLFILAHFTHAKTLTFSHFVWQVRDGAGNPGPNFWSSDNAWVDTNGWLHLKIVYKNKQWYCPFLYTDTRLGFGSYWFLIEGRADKLDPQIVLALFNYPTADIGKDQTNEIDIELSKWGSTDPVSFNTSYTVWPAKNTLFRSQFLTFVKQQNNDVTHGFIWNAHKVFFLSSDRIDINYEHLISSWQFSPTDYINLIPQSPMPIYITLYLFKGVPADNTKETEIIIKKFCFVSDDGKVNNCHL